MNKIPIYTNRSFILEITMKTASSGSTLWAAGAIAVRLSLPSFPWPLSGAGSEVEQIGHKQEPV